MIDHDPAQDQPIASKGDLLAIFHEAEKPASEFRIGAEAEKAGVLEDGARPLHYEGTAGVLSILGELVTRYGWAAEREKTDGPIIALTRNGASITLEPGAQLELSGAPLATIHEVAAELDEHLHEITSITDRNGVAWLGLGFQPFARRDELTFVPKARYGIMREYLPKRGAHALDMMLRTCTVQANYDYANERDAMRKLRVGLKLSPLTTAIFANSPWVEKAPYGGLSYRARVWLDVDPDRSGLVASVWPEQAGYAEYAEWALDVPMFLVKRGADVLLNTGQTFRSFWKDGFEGHRATLADWQLHLNTLFPEVRLKRTLEIRGADMQSSENAPALAALWTGIYYDAQALAAAEEVTRDFQHREVVALREHIHRDGLRTLWRGRPLAELAGQILEIAEAGLVRRCRLDARGRDETRHLATIKQLVGNAKTPADALLESVDPGKDLTAEVIRRARLTLSPRS